MRSESHRDRTTTWGKTVRKETFKKRKRNYNLPTENLHTDKSLFTVDEQNQMIKWFGL